MKGQDYSKPIIDYTTGYAFFDGVLIRSGSFKYLDVDSPCPITPEEQVFVCRQMRGSVLSLRATRGEGLSVLDVGTGSGVLGIYAERLLNENGDLFSTVRALDVSETAISFTNSNASFNSCQKLEVMEEQSYSLDSVAPHSQDIILMNPPFNPTYPKIECEVATLGRTDDFCLGKFREWISIATHHLHKDGVIIGCQGSPVRDGNVLAVTDLLEVLGEKSSVKYAHILDSTCETRYFLEKQYANYMRLISQQERVQLQDWIDLMSATYPHLTFIYFEASKIGHLGEVIIDIDPQIRQYNSSWDERIFHHSILHIQSLKNVADPLATINLVDAENTVKRVKSNVVRQEVLSKSIISQLSQYIQIKLNSHYGTCNSKYLNEYFSGNLCFEFGLLCPKDIDSPQEIFSFSMALPQNLESPVENIQQLFSNYYSCLEFLYDQNNTIFFAPSFFRSSSSSRWSPEPNVITRHLSSKNIGDYLISFSDEFDLSIQSESRQSFQEYQSFLGRRTQPEHNVFPFTIEGAGWDGYFCFESGFIKKTWNTLNQKRDTPETHYLAHSLIHKIFDVEGITFMISVPVYTQDSTNGQYIVTGAFLMFGKLVDGLTSEGRAELQLLLRDFSLDLRKDLTPIIAGYAYHRSGDKQLCESIDNITHELQGFWSLITPNFPPELLGVIQDICLLQFSTYENSQAIATASLKSFIHKPLSELIDYLLFASVLFMIGKDKILADTSLTTDQIRLIINEQRNVFKNMIDITYVPGYLERLAIAHPTNFTVSLKLVLGALNNALSHIKIRRNQRITIIVMKDRVRVVNNYNSATSRERKGSSYLIMRRLCGFLKKDSQELIFDSIEASNLLDKESEIWQSYFDKNEDSYQDKDLWLTQVPISLELNL
jgi:16S rRNA G966 N2-methylase RsmD